MISSLDKQPVEFLNDLLSEAVGQCNSDIYFIPGETAFEISAKTGQAVTPLASLPKEYGIQCVARLKVMAKMLTYRTTIAQDGVIHGVPGAPSAELRVALLPTSKGERATVRILRCANTPQQLDQLGYSDAVRQRLHNLLQRPTGLLILTGPTGAGKTTAIYAMVRELLRMGHNPASIITIEDPVENDLESVSQVQLTRSEAQMGYAEALRAALRHDVKTLVIGEMRDREVVKVALDAALTGHRIITTYHAGDIPSVFARLLHQGFEPFLIAAAVTGVVSQRLLRCEAQERMIPVAAVLEVTDVWREQIILNPGLSELRRLTKATDGADLEQQAKLLLASGALSEKDMLLL